MEVDIATQKEKITALEQALKTDAEVKVMLEAFMKWKAENPK